MNSRSSSNIVWSYYYLIIQALEANNKEVLSFLLNKAPHASLDYSSEMEKNPLIFAIIKDKLDLAMLLLKARANPNIQNTLGWTPLMYARLYHRYKIFDPLLKAGANPDLKNNNQESIYEMEFGGNLLITPILLNNTQHLHFLLNKHPYLDCADSVYLAITLKRHACLELILQFKKPVLQYRHLEKALVIEDINSFRLLLKSGINPNLQDEFQNSILHTACEMQKNIFVKILLEYQANTTTLNKFNETAYMVAERKGNHLCKQILSHPTLPLEEKPLKKRSFKQRESISQNKTSFFNTKHFIAFAFCTGATIGYLWRKTEMR